jgi:hypothetical protein
VCREPDLAGARDFVRTTWSVEWHLDTRRQICLMCRICCHSISCISHVGSVTNLHTARKSC